MTMSMATNAQGAAATTFIPGPWSSGVAFMMCRAIHRTPQQAKETPRSRSAKVSWRRLSCQNTTATLTYSIEAGMSTETETALVAFDAAQNPKTMHTTSAGNFQDLRWEIGRASCRE